MAIWSKGGDETNALVHAFTVGDDYLNDRVLAPYDLLGSAAHARMLGTVGLLKPAEAEALVWSDPMVCSGAVDWRLHRWVPSVGDLGVVGTPGIPGLG